MRPMPNKGKTPDRDPRRGARRRVSTLRISPGDRNGAFRLGLQLAARRLRRGRGRPGVAADVPPPLGEGATASLIDPEPGILLLCLPRASNPSKSGQVTAPGLERRSSSPISARATIVFARSSTPQTDVMGTPSPTARTVDPASPSSWHSRTIGRTPRWPASSCARPAERSTRIRTTADSMRSRMPARPVGHTWSSGMPTAPFSPDTPRQCVMRWRPFAADRSWRSRGSAVFT